MQPQLPQAPVCLDTLLYTPSPFEDEQHTVCCPEFHTGILLFDENARTVAGNTVTLRTKSEAEGWSLKVEGNYWQPNEGTIIQCIADYRLDGSDDAVDIELVPDSMNRLWMIPPGAEAALPQPLLVYSEAAWGIIPPIFMMVPPEQVTDEQLKKLLKEIIELAKKVSAELAKFLEENVVFDDIEDSVARKKDKRGQNTKENVEIALSRKQWADAFLALKKAREDGKQARIDWLLTQLLSQLLHEASHRKGMIEGKSKTTIAEEEYRNCTALIERLLKLLNQIKARMTSTANPKPGLGDGKGLEGEADLGKWFDRIRKIIIIQINYRNKRSFGKTEPWKSKFKAVGTEWKKLKEALEKIRKSGDDTDTKKKKAKEAYDKFRKDAKDNIEALEKEFGVDLKLDYNKDTLKPNSPEYKSNGKWQGAPLPTR